MHPRIPDYQKQLAEGKITRREFLRFTTLLGLSASSALALAACGQPAAAPAADPSAGSDCWLPPLPHPLRRQNQPKPPSQRSSAGVSFASRTQSRR